MAVSQPLRVEGTGVTKACSIFNGAMRAASRLAKGLAKKAATLVAGTHLDRVIVIGSDYYEAQDSVERHQREGKPRLGIGENCKIDNAIIDKNARIGNNVTISPAGKAENLDHERYYIRDGIVIIPKDAVIPDGTVI